MELTHYLTIGWSKYWFSHPEVGVGELVHGCGNPEDFHLSRMITIGYSVGGMKSTVKQVFVTQKALAYRPVFFNVLASLWTTSPKGCYENIFSIPDRMVIDKRLEDWLPRSLLEAFEKGGTVCTFSNDKTAAAQFRKLQSKSHYMRIDLENELDTESLPLEPFALTSSGVRIDHLPFIDLQNIKALDSMGIKERPWRHRYQITHEDFEFPFHKLAPLKQSKVFSLYWNPARRQGDWVEAGNFDTREGEIRLTNYASSLSAPALQYLVSHILSMWPLHFDPMTLLLMEIVEHGYRKFHQQYDFKYVEKLTSDVSNALTSMENVIKSSGAVFDIAEGRIIAKDSFVVFSCHSMSCHSDSFSEMIESALEIGGIKAYTETKYSDSHHIILATTVGNIVFLLDGRNAALDDLMEELEFLDGIERIEMPSKIARLCLDFNTLDDHSHRKLKDSVYNYLSTCL